MLTIIYSAKIFHTTFRRHEVGNFGFSSYVVETDGKTHGPPPGERLLLLCCEMSFEKNYTSLIPSDTPEPAEASHSETVASGRSHAHAPSSLSLSLSLSPV